MLPNGHPFKTTSHKSRVKPNRLSVPNTNKTLKPDPTCVSTVTSEHET